MGRSEILRWTAQHGPLFGACLLVACAASDAPTGPAGESEDPSESDEVECHDEGSMRTCSCSSSGKRGVMICEDGVYGSCDCSDDDDTDDDDDDASTQNTKKPACRAGYYTGEFSGAYRPGVFGFGILPSGLPFDIAGGAMGSKPGLSFTLEESATGAGEFTYFTVGNGCMTGVAKALGTDNPFVARLTGDLDCATGKFEGLLDGYYTLLNFPGANFYFKGPITAQFDREQSRLRDGKWSVMEPPSLSGESAGGGDGTWSAIYDAPNAPQSAEDPCKGLMTSDAGTPSASADAGTASDAGT